MTSTSDTFWVDGHVAGRPTPQAEARVHEFSRDRDGYTLERDFTWGGEAYDAGLCVNSNGAPSLGGYYRFALLRNDRFEVGPTIGVGYLWLAARI